MDAFEFSRPLGHRDVNHYLQNPPNEETWRDYLNEMPFEIRAYLNDVVRATVNAHLTETVSYVTLASKSIASNADVNNVDQTITISLPIAPKNIRLHAFIDAKQFSSDGEWDGTRQMSKYIRGDIGKYAIADTSIGSISDGVANGIGIYIKSVSASQVVLNYNVGGTAPKGTLYLILSANTH